MKLKIALSLFVFIIFAFFPRIVLADGIIIPIPPICDPGPCPPVPLPISQLEIRYHYVDVIIEDQIANTHIDQVFYNPNDWPVEGIYVFPIPRGASVTDFKLWMDGVPVQGKVLNAEEARRTYEEIVREIKDPALLEYADQGALQASIFPIPPKGERRIELDYSEIIPSENGLVRYIYPLNTEKFSTQPLEEVRVHLEISTVSPIRAAYSSSHPVDVIREGEQKLIVGYEEKNVKPDIDFTFYYSIGTNEAFHLLSYLDPGESSSADGFFALLLAPRPDAGVSPLPKDVLVVLDRSGSMEGEKFFQAQEALRYILNHLNPDDRFNLVSFSTGIMSFADVMKPISAADEAISWVNGLSAAGSTDINRALLEAAAMSDQERPTYLIFLTDGLPTEGVVDVVDILENLEEAVMANLRMHAFGVGYDVDTFLLDSLAERHHGSSTYVVPGEQIDEILSGFYARISSPVLTNLELDFGDLDVFDLYPSPLPDLFEGDQIVVVGRYRDGGITDVTLKGEINQEEQAFYFPDQQFVEEALTAFGESQNLQFIPRLWATRKIGHLLNQIRLVGPEQEIIDQIVKISIRYGIVTPYTSYLITEPLPLGEAEQNRIAEEQYIEMEGAQDAPTFGREAVEKGQGELAQSDLASSPYVDHGKTLRVVGSRTFILSDGTWVDTAFDPGYMETVEVSFLSNDYFSLANSRPNLAEAFALGMKVIAISDGIAYEVVEEGVSVDKIDIPAPLMPEEDNEFSSDDDMLPEEAPLNEETRDGEEAIKQEDAPYQEDVPYQEEDPKLGGQKTDPTMMVLTTNGKADSPILMNSDLQLLIIGGTFLVVLLSGGYIWFWMRNKK